MSEQFNLRGRSSSHSEMSKDVASTVAGNQPMKMMEYFKTANKEKEHDTSKVKDNKSLSDGQDDANENFGDDE